MCTGAMWDRTGTLVQALLRDGVVAAGPSPTAEQWWESSEGLAKLKISAGMLEGTKLSVGDRSKLSLVQGERGQIAPPGPPPLQLEQGFTLLLHTEKTFPPPNIYKILTTGSA